VILSVLLLGTMVSLQTFEVEQVLGVPFRFFVFSTMIYDLLVTRVPRYDAMWLFRRTPVGTPVTVLARSR